MKLDFYMECAGFVIGLILCCVCCRKYSILDMRDRIFIKMVHNTTGMSALNIVAGIIIRGNVIHLKMVVGVVICVSFFYMVGMAGYLNAYVKQCVDNKNDISIMEYIVLGLPSFMNGLLMLVNCGTQYIYGVTKVDEKMQVVFNSWYKIPYVLVAISCFGYLFIIWKGRDRLLAREQYVMFLVPVILLGIYYIQYRHKSILVLGFGYSVILLLLYIYEYSVVIRQDELTHLPGVQGFERMLAYEFDTNQEWLVAVVTIQGISYIQKTYGCYGLNALFKHITQYLIQNTHENLLARKNEQFYIILSREDFEQRQAWFEKITRRFQQEWIINNSKEKVSICIDKMIVKKEQYENSQEIIDWILVQ